MAIYDRALRSLAERIGVEPIKHICKQATVQSVHRIAVYYADGRAANSIATLVQYRGDTSHTLCIQYDGLFDGKSIERNISFDDYEEHNKALQKAHFDTLGDMPDRDLNGKTVWCIERASGGLHHVVVMSPEIAQKLYTIVVNSVSTYLAEAIREVPVRK